MELANLQWFLYALIVYEATKTIYRRYLNPRIVLKIRRSKPYKAAKNQFLAWVYELDDFEDQQRKDEKLRKKLEKEAYERAKKAAKTAEHIPRCNVCGGRAEFP